MAGAHPGGSTGSKRRAALRRRIGPRPRARHDLGPWILDLAHATPLPRMRGRNRPSAWVHRHALGPPLAPGAPGMDVVRGATVTELPGRRVLYRSPRGGEVEHVRLQVGAGGRGWGRVGVGLVAGLRIAVGGGVEHGAGGAPTVVLAQRAGKGGEGANAGCWPAWPGVEGDRPAGGLHAGPCAVCLPTVPLRKELQRGGSTAFILPAAGRRRPSCVRARPPLHYGV